MALVASAAASASIASVATRVSATVPRSSRAREEIVGDYLVIGTNPDGTIEAPAVARVERLGDGRYHMVQDHGVTQVEAYCLLRARMLGCAWGSMGEELTVMVHAPNGNNAYRAHWWAPNVRLSGEEEGEALAPSATVVPTSAWEFRGRLDGAGLAFSGRAFLTRDPVAQISWRGSGDGLPGGAYRQGPGVELDGRWVYGVNARGSAGAVAYHVLGGGRLVGVWADPGRPTALGTEQLTRR
jgi:hypothetical protein